MAFYPIRKVPVEQQRKVKLMRYVTSALSIMTVFLLEMFQRTGLKGYDCSEWRLRKVTRTQKKSYSEPVSTISRELDRNKGKKGYRHKKAQGMAQHRIAVKAAKRRKFTDKMWEVFKAKLREGWTP